jgi:hypothetical protein
MRRSVRLVARRISMWKRFRLSALSLALLGAGLMAGCAPEVGSPRWCEAMKEKPRGDWSANEALEFARNCVLN